ncbi:hypothetical protein B0J13DRAFT_567415 [Dactylonectria estremocensis]|uniref:Uncharacterized protein n=1 Tax=Dactylonectria estremocensis TaxID=1079267 RepID=A0A9P9DMJ2_9HYPO|nr:hypothetical protein B0J13DRAFT_567415 [Dactylonectria estremocensis]
MVPPPEESLWTLQSSHNLTPRISLHTLTRNRLSNNDRIRSSGKVTLQFAPDLDPIAGSRNLSEDDRRLDFTPCHLERDAAGNLSTFAFLAGNGRVAGLIGLPRPQGQLTARLVSVGDGFPTKVLESERVKTCIAGGTGIACFLSLASGQSSDTSEGHKSSLICSIRGDDFPIIEFLLDKKMLDPSDWSHIRIFVTPGDDVDGLTAGKPESWWTFHLESIRKRFPGRLGFSLGRMTKKHMDLVLAERESDVLFCGSKSLEWQVKMWLLGRAVVHCTQR